MTTRPITLAPSDMESSLAGRAVCHRVPVTAETVTVLGYRVTPTEPMWTGLYLDLADPREQASLMVCALGPDDAPRDVHLSVPWQSPEDRELFGRDTVDCFYRVRSRIRIGDKFWVREAWAKTSVAPIVESIDNPWTVYQVADNRTDYGGPWKSSAIMPRAMSRLTLTVADIGFERDGEGWTIAHKLEKA